MKGPIQTAITGSEPIVDLTDPHDVLVEFYKAFNDGNYELMESNWLNEPEAAMSNPLGGIKRGWDEIHIVYKNIFGGPADVFVEYFDYTVVEGDGYFLAVGRERGTFALGGKSIELKIRTSRMFVLRDGRYRQLHHHGSIEDPALLDTYRKGVMTGVIE